WQVEEYHRSLKQNASLAKSPTRTVTTQTNHFFAALCAYVKLERLRSGTKLNHYALKTKLYVAALQSAFEQLQTMQPFRFASLEAPA
ncbi:MAG TPA: IS701 family transposase, partial [Anaerolineae bacterium]|nr:IS701 family transposase [Anaerolineae bacterium]